MTGSGGVGAGLPAFDRPSLVCTVGPAACGKSTLATALLREGIVDVRVSTDEVRAELGLAAAERATAYAEAQRRTTEHLASGRTVLYDSTGLLPEHRAPLLALATAAPVPVYAVRIGGDLTIADLRARNRARDRQVPDAVLDEHLDQFRRLAAPAVLRAEGFVVIEVDVGGAGLAFRPTG